MAATLKFKEGFEWSRVIWAGPRDPVSYQCSYCWRTIDERECPLRLMGRRYAVFCEECVSEWLERG